ncbi:MAG: hypothetical protein ACJAWL_001331 [Motiliproteus sp.]|jgi:hypothetical protein
MTFHYIMLLLFLVIPGSMIFFKKYYLVKKGYVEWGSSFSLTSDRICTVLIMIFNIYFIINYLK